MIAKRALKGPQWVSLDALRHRPSLILSCFTSIYVLYDWKALDEIITMSLRLCFDKAQRHRLNYVLGMNNWPYLLLPFVLCSLPFIAMCFLNCVGESHVLLSLFLFSFPLYFYSAILLASDTYKNARTVEET